MLRKQLTVLSTGCFLAMSVHSALALANPNISQFTLDSSSSALQQSKTRYIVQLKGAPAASREDVAQIEHKMLAGTNGNRYDPNSAASIAYRTELRNKQNKVLSSVGVSKAVYHYEHSFNGFAAEMSKTQVEKLKNNPDVLNIWPDELRQMDTANTPRFLGLTSPGGLHDIGVKGEDVIIGIVDFGVWPENPSLDDTGFGPIADTRPDWAGACDVGTDPEFACNNKLIGARYYNSSFTVNNTILPGEFDSPRDADGHGTHTMTTAGGNEGVTASLLGVDVGTVSGIAPRARVAAYKVCWNGSAPGNSGCSTGDSVAAIDDAVADGVDVINFSISGSRTAMTDPVHVAFFNASKGGVFSSLSAGNSGPGAQTVAHNVPWVTTVAASTYDGEAALVGKTVEVTYDGVTEELFSIPGAITTAIPEGGLMGDLVAATPALACGAGLDNPDGELTGKIALIARGTCNFSEKILNAQNAGAVGVLVYSDDREPTAMGGDGTGITIPGVMITKTDGLNVAAVLENMPVSVTLTNDGIASSSTQIGNQMADFSSRGESLATADIIKPDITAPGVQILAGTSGSQIDTGTTGESYAFLSGTSMSSPHIAGMAALIREVNPSWSPAAVKSALMTSARQDVVKENGVTPADPFDYGAGHAVPNSAVNPGLVYDANDIDYDAFLCGAGDADFANSELAVYGVSCGDLPSFGYSLDPSDLNIASIAIESLATTQTIRRYVNNVSGESSYVASVEAPAGIDVEVNVYNFATGQFETSNTMGFNADGLGVYELTFSKNGSEVLDSWAFGSITWEAGDYQVRSPIAIKPVEPPKVVVPESISLEATRSSARIVIPAEIAYNGRFYATAIGMDQSDAFVDTVFQDPDSTFAFNEPGLGFYFVDVPEGTRIAKFALRGKDLPDPTIDLDLYVYACTGFSCSQVGTSLNGGSDESVVIKDPTPKANLGVGDTYLVFVHGWSLNGLETVPGVLHTWAVDESKSTNMSIRTYSRAMDGRSNSVYVGMGGLQSGNDYVGGVLYTDQNGDENAMTIIEVEAK